MKPLRVKRVIELEIEIPNLGSKIKRLRKLSDKPLTKLCEEVGISRQYWYRLERSAIEGALMEETLRRIEAALETDLGVSFPVQTCLPPSDTQ